MTIGLDYDCAQMTSCIIRAGLEVVAYRGLLIKLCWRLYPVRGLGEVALLVAGGRGELVLLVAGGRGELAPFLTGDLFLTGGPYMYWKS